MKMDDSELQNALVKSINNASPSGLLVVDERGIIISHNRKFVEIWGIPGTAVGAIDAPVLSAAIERVTDPEGFLARVRALYDHPDQIDHCEIKLRDGRTLERHSTALHSDSGKYLGRVWFFHDISGLKQAEERLRINQFVSDHAPDNIMWVDEQAHIIYANEATCRHYGYAREELFAKTIFDIDPGSNPAGWHGHWEMLRQKGAVTIETTHRSRDGRVFPVEISANSVSFEGREVNVAFIRDITERRNIVEKLRLTQWVSDHAPDSVVWVDEQARIVYVNEAACRTHGYTRDELLAMSIPDFDPDFPVDAWSGHWQELKQKRHFVFESRHTRKDGSDFPVEISANFVRFEGKELNVAYVRDITERKSAEEEIAHLAFYDPLTQLPNRRLLMDRIQHAMAYNARSARKSALLFIDLDHFKTLNDTQGHDIGDLLLKQVALRLGTCVREGDTVARLGGDEFVLILEDLSEQAVEAGAQTEAIGDKILAALSQPYQLAGHECRSTPSIGATLFSGHQLSAEELMKQADIAMYQAKKAGRYTLRFFDPEMQANINSHADLEKELRQALQKKQFKLYYQVQVDSAQRVLGAEALIRWIHPERGMISPAQFIPLAEETGLILPVGQWVLDTACAQLKIWQQAALTRDIVLAVNVSVRQFCQPEFAAQVQAAVQRHAIDPARLKLELTESLLLGNVEETIATMSALNEIGVVLSLDDFGTGYSSLQYLKRLPLDQLKIDQSFVRDIVTDSNDKAIVKTIIAMAHSMDLSVIAEGVETEEQRQILMDMGCTHFQGYLFSKPVLVEQFEALLERG